MRAILLLIGGLSLMAATQSGVAVTFAQSRGHEFMPCLCCLDVQMLDTPWCVAVPMFVLFGVLFIIIAIISEYEAGVMETEVQRRQRWLKGCKVKFVIENWQQREGVVVEQEGTKCYVNWMNDHGVLIQSIKDEKDLILVNQN